jgi:bla regulator protein BlaR1
VAPWVLNHLWQSSVVTAGAALLALALRAHPARVRFWVWTAASLKFLVPLALLATLGNHLAWRSPTSLPELQTLRAAAQPFVSSDVPAAVPTAPATQSSPLPLGPAVLGVIWLLGTVAVLAVWLTRWADLLRVVLAAQPGPSVTVSLPVRWTSATIEPGVFGIFRPVLLLPAGIADRLSPEQLEALISHELCHARRRDNLWALLHMVVEAVFWFVPPVWWIGNRLIAERERACDEAVLAQGADPGEYGQAVVQVCRYYAGAPLPCVSGVTGADLKRRIADIVNYAGHRRLTWTAKLSMAALLAAVIAVPFVVGMLDRSVRAQSVGSQAMTQATAPAVAKFDVASIKPCESAADADFGRRGGGGAGRPARKAEPAGVSESPGRLSLHCKTLEVLIELAYFSKVSRPSYVTGGPGWMNADRYDVEAKAEGTPSDAALRGPMLRALLEDRFGLALHRETRDMPVYALTTGRTGSKLTPLPEGSCAPANSTPPTGAAGRADAHGCGTFSFRYTPSGNQLDVRDMTVGEFVTVLHDYAGLDRPVVDKTGLTGVFDFHLRYAPDGASIDADAEPLIFTAVQEQLGLKLEAAKGPGEFLVIDHVEKPKPNGPAAQLK